MLNQSAVDALYSATYVEDYIDSVENLPDDLIRLVTRMREMDLATRNYLEDVTVSMQRLATLSDESNEECEEFQTLNLKVQSILIGCQDLGDQKLKVVQEIQDHIENKARQLDLDRKNLESASRNNDQVSREPKQSSEIPPERNIKRAQRRIRPPEAFVQSSVLLPASLSVTAYGIDGRGDFEVDNNSTGGASTSRSSANHSASKSSNRPAPSCTKSESGLPVHYSKEKHRPGHSGSRDLKSESALPTSSASSKKHSEKKQPSETDRKRYKRRRSVKQPEKVPDNIPIDPDEPTYCLCDQISYGEMIGCDNDLCPIEWFHFNCVSLTSKPKGKWYCPKCRGDKPSVMKPKSIFLKELEKYNREKEEKS